MSCENKFGAFLSQDEQITSIFRQIEMNEWVKFQCKSWFNIRRKSTIKGSDPSLSAISIRKGAECPLY